MAELEEIFTHFLDGDEAPADTYPLSADNAEDLAVALRVTKQLQGLRTPAPPTAHSDSRAAFLEHARALGQPAQETGEDALQHSLRLRAAGASIDDCAQAHPHHAYEVRTGLTLIDTLHAAVGGEVPRRAGSVLAAQRRGFLAAARQRTHRSRALLAPARSWQEWLRAPTWARVAVAVLALAALSAFGRTAVIGASGALPGDVLYPVKRVTEQAQLLLTRNETQRAALHERFDEIRRLEAEQVTNQGREVTLRIPGVIESMMDGVWMLYGLQQPVIVSGDALLDGQPAPGQQVLIIAYSDGNGQLLARQVEIMAVPAALSTATPTATATPRIFPAPPTDTPRPLRPTATPMPVWVAPDTPTPASTRTPTPPPSLTATATAAPTITVAATSAPSLTASPGPSPSDTSTPEPAPTDTPTPEPAPTDTPTPELLPTDTPTPDPLPTDTPTSEPAATETPAL